MITNKVYGVPLVSGLNIKFKPQNLKKHSSQTIKTHLRRAEDYLNIKINFVP